MRRNTKTVLRAVPGTLWLLVIWGNSLQTAAESSQRSLGVLAFLMPLISLLGISEDLMHTLVRKLAHMAEFGILGMLWVAALLPKTGKCFKRVCGCGLICLGAAAVDETIQLFVPGRSGELLDVSIDFAGSVLGIAFVILLMRIFRGKNKRKEV